MTTHEATRRTEMTDVPDPDIAALGLNETRPDETEHLLGTPGEQL